ncbi:flagellar hook-length control protein FliK [Helicobacter baculiformis]|uniref:Flagellar hook-length control protein FliK n=1 Tax=Helicobacter baculiformis TaxID=427351 RepID=A0ABV7ZJS9_9HELI|nr:flagellar hook-length control protein FliK [Helicobacter baculiformis]
MAVNPMSLEVAKTPSKGKASSTHKTALADKDAFKHLLSNQKHHFKALSDLETQDTKQHALPVKLSKKDIGQLDKKTSSKTKDVPIDHSPLAHLLDTKMAKLPELDKPTKGASKDPLKKAEAKQGKHAKNAKLSDIKKLETAKKLGLNSLKHEKGTLTTNVEPEAKTLSTQNLLTMQNKPNTPIKDKKVSAVSEDMPKASTKTPASKAPLSQLLEHQGVAQHKKNLAKLGAQKIYGHTPPKDNETNDREIKQAFKEALVQFPPSIYAPQSPLHGPSANKISDLTEKEERPSVSLKESLSHAPVQHTLDKELPKAPLIKETLKNFATELKQELLDFKPPINKLSMELHPDKLGKVEVVIQQVGKNIQVSVSSSAPVAALLSSYNNELRHNLAQMGFNDVDVSFIAHNNTGHGSNNPQQQQGQFQDNHPSQNQHNPSTPPKETPNPPLEPPKSAGLYA